MFENSARADRASDRAGGRGWAMRERTLWDLAETLHREAAIDVSDATAGTAEVPTDGPLRDLLQARLGDEPFVHIANSAGILVCAAIVAEAARREPSGLELWDGDSLLRAVRHMSGQRGSVITPAHVALAAELPRLRLASETLRALRRSDLARLLGRVHETAISTVWVRIGGDRTRPMRSPLIAKSTGCFFTPQFIASKLIEGWTGEPILDPAVGAGALLVEAIDSVDDVDARAYAASNVFGIEVDPTLVELSRYSIAISSGRSVLDAMTEFASQVIQGNALSGSPSDIHRIFNEALGGRPISRVVMNPPFGQLRADSGAIPATKKDDEAIQRMRDVAIEAQRRTAERLLEDVRTSGSYSHSLGGVLDFPRLFLERGIALLPEGGLLSAIVPSTFLSDRRSARLRSHLLSRDLKEISALPESAGLFRGVNQPTAVLVLRNQERKKRATIEVRSDVRSRSDLLRGGSSLSVDLIRAVDPEDLRIPVSSGADFERLRRLHKHPPLDSAPFIANLRGELDLTIHREFVHDRPHGTRLVRGDQIEQFRDDLKSNKAARVDEVFLEKIASSPKAAFVGRPRLAIRQCSYIGKVTRISAARIDDGVVANSCNFLAVDTGDADRDELLLNFLLGVLNSRVINWRFDLLSSTNHVGNYELASLPIPFGASPSAIDRIASMAARQMTSPDNSVWREELEVEIERAYGVSSS